MVLGNGEKDEKVGEGGVVSDPGLPRDSPGTPPGTSSPPPVGEGKGKGLPFDSMTTLLKVGTGGGASYLTREGDRYPPSSSWRGREREGASLRLNYDVAQGRYGGGASYLTRGGGRYPPPPLAAGGGKGWGSPAAGSRE